MEWERSSFSLFYPSLPPTCSHFHFSLLQVVGFSHLTGFFLLCIWSGLLNLNFFIFNLCSEVWMSAPQMFLQTTVATTGCCCLPWVTFMDSQNFFEDCVFCASGKLFCIDTKKNVLQRFCFSSWFFCLHFRGCVDKPWCCPRNQSPWEYAMLNSKYNKTFICSPLFVPYLYV